MRRELRRGSAEPYTVQQVVQVAHPASYKNVTTTTPVCGLKLGRMVGTVQTTTKQVVDKPAWTEKPTVDVTKLSCAARMQPVVGP